ARPLLGRRRLHLPDGPGRHPGARLRGAPHRDLRAGARTGAAHPRPGRRERALPRMRPHPSNRQERALPSDSAKIPVTVLTGFLGSGKTTLVNRILTADHEHRIAVIENEFGDIPIDDALVLSGDEEIIEMSNGCCLCCTARTDLIDILRRLLERQDRFDRILIETSGMADPNPVAQTFFVDEEVAANFELDGI